MSAGRETVCQSVCLVHYLTPPPPTIMNIKGFGGKGVKYRYASKMKINPYLIILFKQ